MDRQGFEILAMGFTGEEALRWKFKYSDAFAAMEDYIQQDDPSRRSSAINAIIEQLAAAKPAYPALWQMMVWTLLEEIHANRYPHPWAIRSLDGKRCLLFRTSHAVEYLSQANHLRHLWRYEDHMGDRLFKRQLIKAGKVVRQRCGPRIGLCRFDHAIAVDLDSLKTPMSLRA